MQIDLLKEMKAAAAALPELHYTVKEPHPMTGEELMLTGLDYCDGKPVEKDKMYTVKMPAKYPINHYRRMRKIYQDMIREKGNHALGQQEAYRAVMDYCTQVIQLKKKQDAE